MIDRLAELRDRGTKILLVEQNVRAALRVATRGYVLRGGAVVLEAPADHLADAEIAVAYLGT